MKYYNIMKKKELFEDKWLVDLMKNVSLETPSDDFTKKLMGRIEKMPVYRTQEVSRSSWLTRFLPWLLLLLSCVVFYFVFPVGENIWETMVASFQSLLSSFVAFASLKSYLIALSIIIATAGLFGVERMISHSASAKRQYLF